MTITITDSVERVLKRQNPFKEPMDYVNHQIDWWCDNLFPLLKERTSLGNVLDIGCGTAIFDIYLQKEFDCKLYLLDKHQPIDEPIKRASWTPMNSVITCDLKILDEFLFINDVKNYKIIDATEKVNWRTIPKLDLIVSIASWGCHYSLREYMEPVLRKLNPDGWIVVTLHDKHPDFNEVSKEFSLKREKLFSRGDGTSVFKITPKVSVKVGSPKRNPKNESKGVSKVSKPFEV